MSRDAWDSLSRDAWDSLSRDAWDLCLGMFAIGTQCLGMLGTQCLWMIGTQCLEFLEYPSLTAETRKFMFGITSADPPVIALVH